MTFLTLAGRVLIFNRFACFVALRLPPGNFFPSFSFLLVAFFPNLNQIKSFIIFFVIIPFVIPVRDDLSDHYVVRLLHK